MEENRDSVQRDEQQVIQEKIVPNKKNSWRRWGKSLLRVVIAALVFGVVAGAALVLSGSFFIKRLGLENKFRQIVEIGSITQVPSADVTPPLTRSPGVISAPASPSPVVMPPEATPEPVKPADGENPGEDSEHSTTDETIRDFLDMYSGIAALSDEFQKSLTQITAITAGVDWFEESYETVGNATGLYVGDNGLDMLFLVNLDSIEGATKFEVTFANGETLPCSIFSYDTNYRLAVLAVRLSAASAIPEESLPERARFAFQEVTVGTPVMVLGNPNGHSRAMELGMVTGTSQVVQVIDDEVLYFTTGITNYSEGDGYVFNLEGEIIGIVSGTLNKGEKGIITAAAVSGLREIIEDTLNNVPRVYCGMRLESVDAVMGGKYNLPSGVYVTEVLPGGPAMYAGIKNGDIITMVGITPVTGVRELYKQICEAGTQNVRIIVNRDIKGERKEQTLFMLPETRLH